MNNIFVNAKFGDRFRTRDGKMAIYDAPRIFVSCLHWILVEGEGMLQMYDNGRLNDEAESPHDIISEWQEPIDEEELGKLANEYEDRSGLELGLNDIHDAYKAGYRDAKQN